MKLRFQRHIIGLSTLALLALTQTAAMADDKFNDVTIKSKKLDNNTYMFVGAGGNIGVSAGSDGILIIDDQYAPLADKITAALNQIQPGAPKYIVNTHYHADHTGGNAHFGEQGTILAHHNVLKRLQAQNKIASSALPVITYGDNISIHFNQDTLEIIHLGPGHTDGDSVVIWQKANIIHMGDLYFKDRFPYIDLDAGGSVTGYRENVSLILDRLDNKTKVIPGHGDLADKNALFKFKHMLDDSINWMRGEIELGHDLASIKKQGVPEKYADWSWEFITADKWIETLYQDLSTQR
ncbi:MBL fold metallo-hydrolase [Shewanella vesiculosa]|uniref:MBL fold metallo-hydrolase n=1 Tax=Shewanella vesiculosa TaxID=518738 RepID=UPI000F510169|nr:MBL fold metallo-hydrolase [Shewanella vesiculosa]RPA55269.1 MBL fold metallo-hydrolase [Shewanella vesiculosa]UJL43301.1 MBL fold metallo-hydrolase [Shewanella vesiculosa]